MTSWRSSGTSKKVFSIMRNSYHNNSWCHCTKGNSTSHLISEFQVSEHYIHGQFTFYSPRNVCIPVTNCPSRVTIKVLAQTVHLQDFISVQNNLLHMHTVEQWSRGCWRWWFLWVYLSTSLWPCPSKVCNKVLRECWVCTLCVSVVS